MSTVPQAEATHVPDDVREFAERQHVAHLIPKVLGVTRRIFPDFRLSVSLYSDHTFEDMGKIYFNVHEVPFTVEQYLQARDAWTFAMIDAVSGPNLLYFGLKLELV